MVERKKSRPPSYQRKNDRILHTAATAEEIECDIILAPLQREIDRLDGRFGFDMLPMLVSVDTAARWAKACAGLHEAVIARDAEKAKAWAIVCLRGLAAMDAEASANPDNLLPPQIWDCEVDGDTFCVIRDGRQHQRAARLRPGSRIYTMREVAVALKAMQTAVVDSVKDIFPGAEIVGTKKTEQPIDDSLDGLFD
jgi:hypothetical protein